MAANVSTNPWIVDTADAASTLIWPTTLKIEHIEFVGYTSDADICQVKNRAGDVIWEGNGNSDLSPVISYDIGFVHGGLAVSRIDSGQVRIYIC